MELSRGAAGKLGGRGRGLPAGRILPPGLTGGFSRRTAGVTGAYGAWATVAALAMMWAAIACGVQPSAGGAQSSAPVLSAPKNLTIGILDEPRSFLETAGNRHVPPIAHDFLMVRNDRYEYQPQLAVSGISLADGTWRVNPDGTMETIWKLRPNIKWHDGTLFTSADLVFTLTALTDPEIDIPILPRAELMRSATAPDPQTFSIQWSGPYTGADATFGLVPMPRHLVESAYLADKADFRTNRWFTTDFVGLGPYRL